jgi:Domain of unknown function (DUF4907)
MRDNCITGIVGLLGFILFGCLQKTKEREPAIKLELQNSVIIRDSIFFSPFGGYGYDIIENGKVKIHQPHIPVIAFQLGFASVEDARRTAQVVISKMKQNQFLPQLTKIELKELGIVR